MKLLQLALALFSFHYADAQTCELVKIVKTYDFSFRIDCPEDVKTKVVVKDSDQNIVWTQKVRIKKGKSEPTLHFKASEPGWYTISIGDFFSSEIEL